MKLRWYEYAFFVVAFSMFAALVLYMAYLAAQSLWVILK